MTLVALGLLLGVAGLLWMMVIVIVPEDHQTQRQSLRGQDKPLVEMARGESKAAYVMERYRAQGKEGQRS